MRLTSRGLSGAVLEPGRRESTRARLPPPRDPATPTSVPGWLGASGGAVELRQTERGQPRGQLGAVPRDGTAGVAGPVARRGEQLWPSWPCLSPWACRDAGY